MNKSQEWIVVVGVVGALAAVSIAWSYIAPEETKSKTPAPTTGPQCNAAWSKEKMTAAQRPPLIVSDMAVRHDGLHIAVTMRQWRAMTIDQRDQLVSAADCAIAGPGYMKAIVVETGSGAILKSYGYLDLYEARKLQP